MKYLKRFNENLINREEIDNICEEYNIKNYTINPDGSVDVDGNVNIGRKYLKKLPLKFGKVTGHFDCNNNQLTSLEGSPIEVGDYLNFSYNRLTTLEGCSKIVGASFYCNRNKLISLEGSPTSVGDSFDCSNNELSSLINSTKKVGGNFDCDGNKLISLIGCPEYRHHLYCNDNPVAIIWNLFRPNRRFIDKINHIYTDLHLGDGWTIQGDIIEQIAEELGVKLLTGWRDSLENKGYKII